MYSKPSAALITTLFIMPQPNKLTSADSLAALCGVCYIIYTYI